MSNKVSLKKAQLLFIPLTERPYRNGILKQNAWFSGAEPAVQPAHTPPPQYPVDCRWAHSTKLSLDFLG
jgi:hypothetical protein